MSAPARHLRPRDGAEQPTTAAELPFDLVCASAVTQLSHLVIDHGLSFGSISRAELRLLVVWWTWIDPTWPPASRRVGDHGGGIAAGSSATAGICWRR